MKHNVKLLDGTTQTLDCKLGSGVYDHTGKEIFEGDIVRLEDARFPIEFRDGCFHVGNAYLLWRFSCIRGALEIVGHVEEDAK